MGQKSSQSKEPAEKIIKNIRRATRSGGLGYYPKSGFVHLDIGRVRYW